METYPTSPQPLKTSRRSLEFKTLVTSQDFGVEQRRHIWGEKYSFNLSYDVLTKADATILWNFYVARAGALEAFNYTDLISKNVYKVRFIDDSLSMQEFQHRLYRTGINLIQVF